MVDTYCAIICRVGDEPYLVEYVTLEALVKDFKDLVGQEVFVFPFYGQKLSIGVNDHKAHFLMTPSGNLPLFDTKAEIEIVETGYLGDE